ncbi:MAG TPA: (2Fe-2S) ferredoxin domain-containing protein, partial [Candidatus Scalindua sp.]|nr:(2Fe-2S) ferredoxin domain-containing protein [Candidatus Scalindua sp.]
MLKRLMSYGDLVSMRKSGEKKFNQNKVKVSVCMTGCRALGAEEVYDEFRKQVKKQKLQDKVEVIETGCQGLCARAPVMTINPPGAFSHRRIFYGRVTTDIVPDIISSTA